MAFWSETQIYRLAVWVLILTLYLSNCRVTGKPNSSLRLSVIIWKMKMTCFYHWVIVSSCVKIGLCLVQEISDAYYYLVFASVNV
jgi:hypothetical protein